MCHTGGRMKFEAERQKEMAVGVGGTEAVVPV